MKDLMTENNGDLLNYQRLILLHEDKYTKKDYSLVVIENLPDLVKIDGISTLNVFKDAENLSDSEIDCIIDLRKLLSNFANKEVTKDTMPSNVQQV